MIFSGSIVALITPFRNNEIDVKALQRLVSWHIQEGTQAIVACGSTGEAILLTPQERVCVLSTILEAANGQIPVIAGCGAPSTQETLDMVKQAKELGCAAALVVTPFYVKPTEEGIFQHFSALNTIDLPILIYNNPGRAVVGLSVDLVVRLATLSNVVGIKDSCDDLTRVIKMRHLIQKPFSFLSGDDPIATAYLAHGGDGVISVTANVVPKQCHQLTQSWKNGDLSTFARLRDTLSHLHEAVLRETNPSPIKYAVSTLGYCEETVRLPLVPVTQKTKEMVQEALKKVANQA